MLYSGPSHDSTEKRIGSTIFVILCLYFQVFLVFLPQNLGFFEDCSKFDSKVKTGVGTDDSFGNILTEYKEKSRMKSRLLFSVPSFPELRDRAFPFRNSIPGSAPYLHQFPIAIPHLFYDITMN